MNSQKIAETAVAAVRRQIYGFPTTSGWCVAFTFEAIARAYDTNRWVIYSWLLDRTNADPDRSRWATDVEIAVQRAGWAISKKDYDPSIFEEREALIKILQPGYLLLSSHRFDELPQSPRTAPDLEGHVGIYVGRIDGVPTVAENTRADRGRWYGRKNAMRLTPLSRWDTVTTVASVIKTWKP